MTTSSEWIRAFSKVTLSPYITNLNVARALRDAELFARPSRGQGHKKTPVTASDLSNYFMAQASQHVKDVAEVVTRLRRMRFLGSNPFFGAGNFGDVFDRMIAGQHPPSAEPRFLPTLICLSTQPYRAELRWLRQEGSHDRVETYAETGAQGWEASSYLIVKKTYIDPQLIMFAAQMLKKPLETKSATPARAALPVEQSTDERSKTPARRSAPNSTDPKRARVHSQRLTHTKKD